MNLARSLLATLFVIAGILHFAITPVYTQIMPSFLPAPRLLVQISGLAEILGGLGLLIPALRPAAAWGLIALLIAVLPANLHMALHPAQFPASHPPSSGSASPCNSPSSGGPASTPAADPSVIHLPPPRGSS